MENGKITKTFLGKEDHGIFTSNITIEFDGRGQGFGGYSLDGKGGKKGSGIGFISKILDTLEVDSWENLKGTHLRVKREDGLIKEIGHIVKDKWFNPKEYFQG